MTPTQLELVLWLAGFLGHSTLLFVLVRRRRVKMFPLFTALIIFNLIKSAILFFVHRHTNKDQYLVVYFWFAQVDYLLQLAVVSEIAWHVFCPTGTWAPDTRKGAFALVIASFVFASVLAVTPIPPEQKFLKFLLDRENVFSSAVVCELFVGMIVLSVTANLPWKTHAARIAQGLGFYSLIGLLTESGHNVTGMKRSAALSHELTMLREITYLICLGYWIVTLWANAPAPLELSPEMRQLLFTVQRILDYDLRRRRLLRK